MSLIKYTPEQLYEIGKKSKDYKWSNEELDQQIEILEIIIPYFEGREDSKIITSILNIELNNFKSMKMFRELHKL